MRDSFRVTFHFREKLWRVFLREIERHNYRKFLSKMLSNCDFLSIIPSNNSQLKIYASYPLFLSFISRNMKNILLSEEIFHLNSSRVCTIIIVTLRSFVNH